MSVISKTLIFFIFLVFGASAQARADYFDGIYIIAPAQAAETGGVTANNTNTPPLADLGTQAAAEAAKKNSENNAKHENVSENKKDIAFLYILALVSIYCVVVPVLYLIFTSKFNGNIEIVSRYYLVITIICSTMIVLVAGYTETQMAPVFGLLGSILGYLFGRTEATTEKQKDEKMDEKNA